MKGRDSLNINRPQSPGTYILDRLGSRNWTPQIPTGLTAIVAGSTEIDLSWVNNETGSYDGLEVHISTDNVTYTLKEAISIATTYPAINLTAGLIYFFKIRLYKGTKYSDFSDFVTALTAPSELYHQTAGVNDVVLWVKHDIAATITKDGSDRVSSAADILASGHNLVQAGADNLKPIWSVDGITGDGIRQFLRAAFTLDQPLTYFISLKILTWHLNDTIIDGASGYSNVYMAPSSPSLRAYAGNQFPENPNLFPNKWGVIQLQFSHDTNDSFFKINQTPKVVSISIGTGVPGGITLFGNNVGTLFANVIMRELIVFKGKVSDATALKVYNYMKYVDTQVLTEVFDSVLDDSVNLATMTGYNIRTSFASFSFNCSDDYISVAANPTIPTTHNRIAVYENDVFKEFVTIPVWDYVNITLTAGTKKVTLVESDENMPVATILGTFITSILVNNAITKVVEGSIAEKIVFLGDSNTSGFGCTNPITESFPRLFKIENSKPSACYAFGYNSMKKMASDAGKVTATVGFITGLFSNVTTNKYLVIALGTNDNGIDNTDDAVFQGWYEALLDAVHVADAAIKVFALSPVIRNDIKENANLDDIRTATGTVCTARNTYCTHIPGKPICVVGDLIADNLHLSTGGAKKVKDAIHAVMYP